MARMALSRYLLISHVQIDVEIYTFHQTKLIPILPLIFEVLSTLVLHSSLGESGIARKEQH